MATGYNVTIECLCFIVSVASVEIVISRILGLRDQCFNRNFYLTLDNLILAVHGATVQKFACRFPGCVFLFNGNPRTEHHFYSVLANYSLAYFLKSLFDLYNLDMVLYKMWKITCSAERPQRCRN